MGATLKINLKEIEEAVKKGSLNKDDMADVVEEVAQAYYEAILREIPIAEKNSKCGYRYFDMSVLRLYPDQVHVTLKFIGNNADYVHLFYQNYDVRSPNFHWFERAVQSNQGRMKKLLESLAKAKINSKG